jgi:hypothetical protein
MTDSLSLEQEHRSAVDAVCSGIAFWSGRAFFFPAETSVMHGTHGPHQELRYKENVK